MLFVIAMDVLNYLLSEADACTLLEPIGGSRGIPHRLSLYADDATLFLTPIAPRPSRCHLDPGEASGLHTNLAKSSISPIRCTEEHLQLISAELQCHF